MHVFLDAETHRFAPARRAPPIVCVQFCVDGEQAHLMTKRGEQIREDGFGVPVTGLTFSRLLASWINGGALLVGHHIAYDLACFCAQDSELVPLVFSHYRRNGVTDTLFRQKLADIGRGRHRGFQAGDGWVQLNYNLGDVARRHGFHVNKDEPFRLYYSLLADVPLDQWCNFSAWVPVLKKDVVQLNSDGTAQMVLIHGRDAIRYGLDDPKATRAAYCGQAQRYDAALLVDEYQQARKFWALDLASTWGLRTSFRGVLSLEKGAREHRDHLAGMLLDPTGHRAHGQACHCYECDEQPPLIRPKSRKPGAELSRDTTAAKARMVKACRESGMPVRLTKKEGVCLDSDACKSSGDPLLEAYADYSSMVKVLSNDVEMLHKGVVVPIHTHFDLADTGRVTSAKPNVMNPRRLTGVRECYVPRGYRE